MLSVVRIDPHTEGTLHSHPEEQWGVILEGECIRIQDGQEIPAKAGDFWCTRGGVEHSVRTGDKECVVLDILAHHGRVQKGRLRIRRIILKQFPVTTITALILDY
jgi:quercetin dioxygenase-like cupin family protein